MPEINVDEILEQTLEKIKDVGEWDIMEIRTGDIEDTKYIYLKKDDAYIKEEIRIYPYPNKYFTRFKIECTHAKKDDELANPAVFAQHDMGEELSDEEIEAMGHSLEETIRKIDAVEPIEIGISFSESLKVAPTIVEEDCLINIPHTHYYIGVWFELSVGRDEIISFLKLLHIFLNIFYTMANIY